MRGVVFRVTSKPADPFELLYSGQPPVIPLNCPNLHKT